MDVNKIEVWRIFEESNQTIKMFAEKKKEKGEEKKFSDIPQFSVTGSDHIFTPKAKSQLVPQNPLKIIKIQ